jgi:hypothetical protein
MCLPKLNNGVSSAMRCITIVLAILVSGCSVPERHVPGGPYCVVLYADYSLRPARLLGKSRSEAREILESGRAIKVAFFSSAGLLERTRECWKTKCSDWSLYDYDSNGRLSGTQTESASDSKFDVASCPESAPQAMVKLPREGS